MLAPSRHKLTYLLSWYYWEAPRRSEPGCATQNLHLSPFRLRKVIHQDRKGV
jgi:hypothetical protein